MKGIKLWMLFITSIAASLFVFSSDKLYKVSEVRGGDVVSPLQQNKKPRMVKDGKSDRTIGRGNTTTSGQPLKRLWLMEINKFLPSKILVSDFEQQIAGGSEWVGTNVDISRKTFDPGYNTPLLLHGAVDSCKGNNNVPISWHPVNGGNHAEGVSGADTERYHSPPMSVKVATTAPGAGWVCYTDSTGPPPYPTKNSRVTRSLYKASGFYRFYSGDRVGNTNVNKKIYMTVGYKPNGGSEYIEIARSNEITVSDVGGPAPTEDAWNLYEMWFVPPFETSSVDNGGVCAGFVTSENSSPPCIFQVDDVELYKVSQDYYPPISGKAYLRMRVNAGAAGSIIKSFDTPQDFSRHHFQWWLKGESLARTDLERPAYHSEIDFDVNIFGDQFYEAYIYFYSDANNYSRYQFTFPPQYNDWYHVALHRGDMSKTDTGRGVNWSRVKKIKFEVKGKTIPFGNEDVDVTRDTIRLHKKKWAPLLHTGAKVQFIPTKKLPGGLLPSTFYWVHDEGEVGDYHAYKFSTSKDNLKDGIYVDLTCDSGDCSGNVVTLPDIMLDKFEAVETLPVPFITFRFDDNYQGTYANAKPILDEFGWKGVFAVATQKETTEGYDFCLDCGRDNFVSYDEVRKMQDDGWDIAAHGFHHFALGDLLWTGLPDTNVEKNKTNFYTCYNLPCTEEEFSMARMILESEGLMKGARFWVWPFGQTNAISDIALRLIPKYYALGSWCNPKAPAGIPLTNRYTLPIADMSRGSTEVEHLAWVKKQIDATCGYGGWLTLLFHYIYLPEDRANHGIGHTTTFLKNVCDYIKMKQQNSSHPPVVVTFSDIFDTVVSRGGEVELNSGVTASRVPPVTRHSRPFQLLPAEDGLVKICAANRPIVVTLPSVAQANGRIYTLCVSDIVSPNTITVIPKGNETIQGKGGMYAGLDAKEKILRIQADSAGGNWIILSSH